MSRASAVVLVCAMLASGCTREPTSSQEFACTTSVEPALVVFISDSVTARPLASAAVGVARDGLFQDSLRPRLFSSAGELLARSGADERQGVYRVTVTLAGYRTWTSGTVAITRNVCHVNTQTLLARLQPASQ